MRYANTRQSHHGIGVEPNKAADRIEITGTKSREAIAVADKPQLRALISILRDASLELGWGAVE